MHILLAILGVVVVLIAVWWGWSAGEIRRIEADPEVQEARRKHLAEEERKRRWREHFK
jgi:uncharacterized membrane protein YozB (DUF420 family)